MRRRRPPRRSDAEDAPRVSGRTPTRRRSLSKNSFDPPATLKVGGHSYEIFRLDALQAKYDVARLPFSLKILLENLLRNEDGETIRAGDIEALASWDARAELEFERNQERYAFLRWGQTALRNFKVVPPDTGIVHQVNLEYLARVVFTERDGGGQWLAYPDTLVGTDSHTKMNK